MTTSFSKIGGRRNNQDYCSYFQKKECSIWIVADGMGGHFGGEFASSIATESILEAFQTVVAVNEENVRSLLQFANDRVRTAQKEIAHCDQMQTTVVFAMTNGETTILANIGDSRCYYFSGGKIVKQTKDHSIPQLLANQGEIKQGEIRYHEDRNKVLKSIGKDDWIKPDFMILNQPLKREDAFLLCSDGFWECVLESEMEIDLIKSKTTEEWLRRMEMRLFPRMSDHHDNYSAIAVFCL